jgi:hypothetical protein
VVKPLRETSDGRPRPPQSSETQKGVVENDLLVGGPSPQGRKAFYLPIAEDTFAASFYMDLNDNPALPSTPLPLGEPTAAAAASPGESRAAGSIDGHAPQR